MTASIPPPATRMARKFVTNRSSAPSAESGSPLASMTPTTHRGGTSEMAMATPGRASDTLARLTAKAPAAPDARATIRSIVRGEVRAATWLFDDSVTTSGLMRPMRKAVPMATTTPAATSRSERRRCPTSPVTTERADAMIGVIRGATIIAPMTTAVESVSTPPVAMTTANRSSAQKRT